MRCQSFLPTRSSSQFELVAGPGGPQQSPAADVRVQRRHQAVVSDFLKFTHSNKVIVTYRESRAETDVRAALMYWHDDHQPTVLPWICVFVI